MIVRVRACAVGILEEENLAVGGGGRGEIDGVFGGDGVVIVVVSFGGVGGSRCCWAAGRFVSGWMSVKNGFRGEIQV